MDWVGAETDRWSDGGEFGVVLPGAVFGGLGMVEVGREGLWEGDGVGGSTDGESMKAVHRKVIRFIWQI